MKNTMLNISRLSVVIICSLILSFLFADNAWAQRSFKRKPLVIQKNTTISPKIFGQLDPEMYKPEVTNRDIRQASIQLPFAKSPQTLNVEVIDGLVLLDGDIIVGRAVEVFGDGAAAISGNNYRWTNGEIPYVIANNHPKRNDILSAISRINAETKLCLSPRTNQSDYVEFISGGGCASWVGKQGGRQEIVIGGCSIGSIQHEILHASGLFHEQSRQDRDSYITINWNNITAGKSHNFQKYTDRGYAGVDLGSYDFGSIMHYGPTAFSKNGQPTIVSKVAGKTFGQRTALSTGDKSAVAALYPNGGCNTGGSTTNVTEDCISFNYNNISIKPYTNGRYRIIEGTSHAMFVFPNYAEAKKAYDIIKYYKMNKSCFVGRPDPSFEYMLVNNNAPQGNMSGEDCISFNPNNIQVKQISGRWKIIEGSHYIFDFGSNYTEAKKTYDIIKKHGFRKTCYVGRPDPSFQYMKK
ncbi:MAG: M12 family metallopeptidase [Chitinophagales bacterium]